MPKHILITGASTGIGAETARVLAEGNTIFVHYNASQEPAEKVAQNVNDAGGKAIIIQADLSTEDGCRALVQTVSANTDKLDVLVNNAGGLIKRQGVQAYEWGLMENIFALNTFSTMMVTSLCLPFLQKGESPSIINITSVAMRHGGPTATIYAASKAALRARGGSVSDTGRSPAPTHRCSEHRSDEPRGFLPKLSFEVVSGRGGRARPRADLR